MVATAAVGAPSGLVPSSFSPLAGIRWLQLMVDVGNPGMSSSRFSPLAGIRWLQLHGLEIGTGRRTEVSVPSRGFDGCNSIDFRQPMW